MTRNNPFTTGRTFDAVGDGLAEALVDAVQDSKQWRQLLIDIATGDAEPNHLPGEFQALLEAAYLEMVEQKKERGEDSFEARRRANGL